ncbi:hypothetical protein B0T19DRAFT_243211 [Cercophora scortea]|uniref:Uncharacterized protein n=1 Tax=Cercophora scortea TaxID=314031 RepID=A0AAE0M6Q1_9PEZI|nr:hypothetical protein B0T19DRAFT_243211 [Cercophora scortea]
MSSQLSSSTLSHAAHAAKRKRTDSTGTLDHHHDESKPAQDSNNPNHSLTAQSTRPQGIVGIRPTNGHLIAAGKMIDDNRAATKSMIFAHRALCTQIDDMEIANVDAMRELLKIKPKDEDETSHAGECMGRLDTLLKLTRQLKGQMKQSDAVLQEFKDFFLREGLCDREDLPGSGHAGEAAASFDGESSTCKSCLGMLCGVGVSLKPAIEDALSRIFAPLDKGERVRPTRCFAAWLAKHSDTGGLDSFTPEELFDMITGCGQVTSVDWCRALGVTQEKLPGCCTEDQLKAMAEWEQPGSWHAEMGITGWLKRWEPVKGRPDEDPERVMVRRELLLRAFTTEYKSGIRWYYSFCSEEWENKVVVRHSCSGLCYELRDTRDLLEQYDMEECDSE